MAGSVNSNASAAVRVRTNEREQASESARGGQQQVEVSQRGGGQNEAEVQDRGQRPVEQPAPRHAATQSYVDESVEQAVSQLPGSNARHMEQQRQQAQQVDRIRQQEQTSTPQQRISGLSAAEVSGMAAPMRQSDQAASAARNVPVLDASQVGSLDVMTSRKPVFSDNTLQVMRESDQQLRSLRAESRGRATPAVPSAAAVSNASGSTRENTEARRLNQTDTRETENAAIATNAAANTSATNQPVGRPDTVMNRPVGWQAAQRQPKLRQPSQKRQRSVVEAEKNRNATAFNNEGRGNHVYGKVNGMRSLRFREVAVGSSEIYQAAQQNPEMLNRLFRAYDDNAPDAASTSVTELRDYVNSKDMYVATFKPPDNRSQDAQSRRLRVTEEQSRGIYLHPVMAAMYTADFDGDDMSVSFDPDVESILFDPMRQIVDIFGEQTLNTDFLPVVKILDNYEPGKKARDFIRITMLKSVSQADWNTVNPVIDAIMRLGDTADTPKRQSAAWGDVFREVMVMAEKIAGRSTNRANTIMERVVKDVYQTMHDVFVNTALRPTNADIVSVADLPEPKTYSDITLYKVLDGIVEGKAPNNFQDLKIALTGYLGDVEGKNAPFRFTADVGKVTKMDSRLQVGNGDFVVDPNNPEQMKSLFETTMKYAESHRMAVGYKKAGRSMYYTQALKERVMSEVGMPSNYSSYKDFIDTFVESYTTASAMINQSNLSYTTTMRIKEESAVSAITSSKGGMTAADIADPLISVYGLQSVGTMFPELATTGIMNEDLDPRWKGTPGHVTKLRKYGDDVSKAYEREYENSTTEFFVSSKYSQWSIRKFAHENRMVRGGFNPTKLSSMDDMDNAHVELEVLLAIADKATSTASKFNEVQYGKEVKVKGKDGVTRTTIDYENTAVKMTSELLDDIAKSDGTDRMLWVNDDVDTLIANNPDLFHHFDMDSPAGFLHSEWAQAMLDARHDMDLLGGIRLAMVADWRMERITALQNDMPSNDDYITQWAIAQNNLQLAKDELAASSEVWHGIIREFEMEDTPGEKSVFQMMRENKDGMLYKRNQITGERYAWTANGEHDSYYARSFWNNPGGHMTLRSVIEDTHMGIKEKQNIIADVVRYWENDLYLNSWEVGFQMEIGNDSSYSLNGSGQQSALKSYRDFEQAFNHWGKVCQEKLAGDIRSASKKYRRRSGYLMATLRNLSEHFENLVEIDDHMFADSIMSVFDKNYAQSEKAKQHPWDNTIYSGLSMQLNGGVMNDVERTNDRMVGVQSMRSITVSDVIRVLADPNESIEVYDDYGRVSDPVTRDDLIRSLLGREPSADVESDIWDLLEQNPRIASALRIHGVNTLSDMDGKAYLGASRSISETIEECTSNYADPVKRTKALLRDHPDYAALISLATPARGAVTRRHRERIVQNEAYLAYRISQAAVTDYDAAAAAEWILGDLGITQTILRDVMASDYDKYLSQLKLPVMKGSVDETNADADAIWYDALRNLTQDIEDVRKDLPQNINVGETPLKPGHLGVDISSLASYWDITQDLGGSKTNVSTGIEGAETFRWGQWASHIQARDTYANLAAVRSDVDASWNGLWTSEGEIEVGENGSIAVGGTPLDDFDSETEIVSAVPDGYRVQDRSVDRHGNQVSSLFAYSVSKRSNGAEKFNLKAKKAGHDASRSIVKMHGRYRTVTDEDTGETYRASFQDTRNKLQNILDETGDIRAVQLELAQMMLRENEELGYEDLTLSNYMCIAEVMAKQTENGQLVLRTLPMLYEAIKYRVGTAIDEMNEKQRTKAINDVVNDVSETGIGVVKLDPIMVLDGLKPCTKSMVKDGIRPHSSSFERNYSLMQTIEREAMRDGVLAESQQTMKQVSSEVMKAGDVASVMERSESMRGYTIVGRSGRNGERGYVRWAVGPQNAIVIGDGADNADEVIELCDRAYKYGMTVIVSAAHLDLIPESYAPDAMPCSDVGDAVIPMFDIRLNGSEATPYNGGRFAIFQVDPTRYVTSVEDPLNYFVLGDAQYKPTEYFANRVKNIDSDSQQISAEDLFPNVFRNPAFAHSITSVSFASGDTLSRLIADGVKCTIDYGLVEGANGWKQRVHDVNEAIKRYQERWSSTDADGMMCNGEQDCQPGDIVAWAECSIMDQFTGEEQYVLAPIIPFPLHETKRVPETYSVEQVTTIGDDNMLISVDWTNTSDVTKSNAKYFDSSGGANKGIIDFVDSIKSVGGKPLMLRDGTPIDNYIAKASTDSRKVGTDRRVKTMITLMTKARLNGYNFAKSDKAFPNDPDLKERLLHERIPSGDWVRIMRDGITLSSDPKIDAFLKYEYRKISEDGGNFSDYLACTYSDANGIESNTHVMWEFEAMFERGVEYENCLLKFLHSMDDKFCPNGFDDTTDSKYLFRLKPDAKDFDYGVLEMEVPYPLDNGNVAYLWANAYIGMSFFGEEYSGFSQPNVDGASNFMDAMNTYAYYGAQLDERQARFRHMWATSDLGRIRDGGAIGKA